MRTKDTLLSAMVSEMDSLREQLAEKRLDVERLTEHCQQLSGVSVSGIHLEIDAIISSMHCPNLTINCSGVGCVIERCFQHHQW